MKCFVWKCFLACVEMLVEAMLINLLHFDVVDLVLVFAAAYDTCCLWHALHKRFACELEKWSGRLGLCVPGCCICISATQPHCNIICNIVMVIAQVCRSVQVRGVPWQMRDKCPRQWLIFTLIVLNMDFVNQWIRHWGKLADIKGDEILQLLVMRFLCWWQDFDTPPPWDMDGAWGSDVNEEEAATDVQHECSHKMGFGEEFENSGMAESLCNIRRIEDMMLCATVEPNRSSVGVMNCVHAQAHGNKFMSGSNQDNRNVIRFKLQTRCSNNKCSCRGQKAINKGSDTSASDGFTHVKSDFIEFEKMEGNAGGFVGDGAVAGRGTVKWKVHDSNGVERTHCHHTCLLCAKRQAQALQSSNTFQALLAQTTRSQTKDFQEGRMFHCQKRKVCVSRPQRLVNRP